MNSPLIKGYLLALLGVFILSPDALLIRLLGDDPLQISVYRGILAGSMVLVYNQFLDRRSLYAQLAPVGALGVIATSVVVGVSQLGFVFGISHANVTDVLVIIAFAPLASAFMSAMFLGEKVTRLTWAATLVCGVGLAILFGQSGSESSWFGLASATVCALTIAGQFVLMRGFPNENMTGCMGIGYIISGVVCLFMATDLTLESHQYFPIFLMVMIVSPIPFVLFILSLRYVSAAETSLIMLMESILGTFWVWLVLSEKPSLQTALAGTLVIGTLLVYSGLSLKNDAKNKADDRT
ncbi:MAG: DMT family transporter [Leucothrix sp.]